MLGSLPKFVRSAILVAAVAANAGTAAASDTFRECKSLDGSNLTLDAETLELKRPNGEKVAYNVIDRMRIREIAGYCSTRNGRYRFSTEVLGLTIGFTEKGSYLRRKFRCETSTDATPGGLSCDREVRTIDFQAPAKLLEQYR